MAKGKKKKKKDPLQAKKDMISIIIIGAGIVIGLFLGMVLVTVSQQKSGVKQVAVYVEGGQSFKLSTKLTVLEDVLKETYGVIVYQEQVMRIAQIIAGFTLGQADILWRDMGKRKREKLAEHLERFKAGAVKNGFTEEHAEEIFHILERFAGYSFNKSHAVAYSIIAYQTAFLKANYPDEFYAAMRKVGKIDCVISTIVF